MPNWCNNNLVIRGSASALKQLHDDVTSSKEFFEKVIPMPEDQKDNWYNWCVENWGTKWDVEPEYISLSEPDEHNQVTLTMCFDSAWAPPLPVAERLTDMGFDVELTYHEPGMCYAGRYTSEHGDDYYEYSNMSSKEVADMLPADIDNMLGISEYIKECEDEEKDDLTLWYEEGVEQNGLAPHDPEKILKELSTQTDSTNGGSK